MQARPPQAFFVHCPWHTRNSIPTRNPEMIVRKYTRRTRCTGRSFSDAALLDGGGATAGVEDVDFMDSQESSQDPFALPFSSQDSSPWSLDPILTPPEDLFAAPLRDPSSRPGKRQKGGLKRNGGGGGGEDKNPRAATTATATLMEAQEFGEMMEHVDEVNFALDGLRAGQPARIRRASLLSLLSICGTAQRRRLLRAQGMTKRIIDAVLGLTFNDSPSTVAAAALFFVLASDLQDDHLLDSPSCIHFLIKLLKPPPDTAGNKAPSIGSKFLGIRNPHILCGSDKGIDSSSRAIISKVREILLSCKEIKLGSGDDEETERPELSSKWISLLTMEKACLSTVSFEDTSDTVKRAGGNFKERLRELGGLDAIFDVVASCHSTMEGWVRNKSPSVPNLKDGVTLKSLVLILKCLKIMENATFLSKDNQAHLLGMKRKNDSEGFPLSFVGVIVSTINFFSDLSLVRSSSTISNTWKSNGLSKSVDTYSDTEPEVQMKESLKDNQNGSSSGDNTDHCGIEKGLHEKSTKVRHKRQKLSTSQSEVSVFGSEMTIASGAGVLSVESRGGSSSRVSCNGALTASNGPSCITANCLELNKKANRLKLSSEVTSVRASNGCISINSNASKMNSNGLSQRLHVPEVVKSESLKDSYDPFAFGEDDVEPSKWELLAMKKEPTHAYQSAILDREFADGCDRPLITIDQEFSQLINEEDHLSCESSCPLAVEEDSNLLEDCLLAAVKVLMNLTNDNPVGCQQIAACGGLDTMASLIISHFPSFHSRFPLHNQSEYNVAASMRSIDDGHLNHKHLSDHELDFLVAILGLLVNLVEKDSGNRSRLASACILVGRPGRPKNKENPRDVITLLCSIFLANQGVGEASEEGRLLVSDEASLLQGEREAEMMIIEAYAALLLAFLSTESPKVRGEIARCLPNDNLEVLVPVLEKFVVSCESDIIYDVYIRKGIQPRDIS